MIPTAITGLNANSTVAGQITLSWSGGLGSNVIYSYVLSTGTIQSVSGSASPVTITLTSTNSVTTTVTLTATVLGGSTSATSLSVITTTPITATVTGYTSSVVNGSYTIFTYNIPGYTLSNAITLTGPTSLYVLAVGGGGSGGSSYSAGGGGAGGLVQSVLNCTGNNDVISIYVGQGGAAATGGGNNGQSTTFTITGADSANSFTAYGGGVGGGASAAGSGNNIVGSGGGGNSSNSSFNTGGTGTTGQGNSGGTATASSNNSGGGGGAGGSGATPAGGAGIITNTSTLTALSGSTYASYYWGGGGGGGYANVTAGSGGIGGGGGGSSFSGASSGTFGTGGITTGQNVALATVGGAGCANTGGGGGGSSNNQQGGYGGSGAVLVSIPTVYIVAPTVWSNANIPQPKLYFPFSKDMLNYASGTGVPFWYNYQGTGAVSITSGLTLNGSAGCLQSTAGTSCLMATTGYPNNSFIFPTNSNGYTFSLWVYSTVASGYPGQPFSINVSGNTSNYGIQLYGSSGLNGGIASMLGTGSNIGGNYGFTINTWHHIVMTMTTSGAISYYFYPSSSSVTGTSFTGTGTYSSSPGYSDFRIFGSNNANGTGLGANFTGFPYSYLNTSKGNTTATYYISDFYYFDAILTLAQIQWLHSNQAIH